LPSLNNRHGEKAQILTTLWFLETTAVEQVSDKTGDSALKCRYHSRFSHGHWKERGG